MRTNISIVKSKWGWMLGVVSVLMVACQQDIDEPQVRSMDSLQEGINNIIPGEYIVQLHPSGINFRKEGKYADVQASLRKSTAEMLASYRISAENLRKVYGHALEGFAVKLSDEELEMLQRDPRVKSIEQDRVIAHAPPSGKGGGKDKDNDNKGPKKDNSSGPGDPEEPSDPEYPGDPSEPSDPEPTDPEPFDPVYDGPSTQEVPWGIKRVGGFSRYSGNNVAFVIDTGIELDHPDLNVNEALGFKAVPDNVSTTLSDKHSHGTHVAGIIGAIDNHFGVVGVAAGVPLVPIKVMGDNGSGNLSWLIAGVDYVAAVGKPGDVANISLGTSASSTLDNAVITASSNGIWFVTSAGNNADNANNYSPARANGPYLYTVSSMDSNDVMAASSNYGNPPIDWAAPGRSVKSTVLNGGYGSKSGTSMASPHVAGLRLLGNIRADGYIKQDKDNSPDPIAHRAD